MRTQETADGIAYTHEGYTIVFPYGSARPYLLWGSGTVRIENPERFGSTDTVQARRAFMRAFTSSDTTYEIDDSHCRRCGAEESGYGDGYDGLCPSCADKADASGEWD